MMVIIMHDGRWEIAGQNTHKKCRSIKYIKLKNWKTQN